MSFTIKQGRFEGPYHKLLELIESRKLSINEISLSLIADEYVAHIKTIQKQTAYSLEDNIDTKDDVSQFIVVAATLMLIKAKSLLPTMEYSKEEAIEVSNLEHKLMLYKTLIDNSQVLKSVWNIVKVKSGKSRMKIDAVLFSPGNLKSITLQSVSILTIVKLPHLERLRQVAVAQAFKIEHVIDNILSHMRATIPFSQSFSFKNIVVKIFEKFDLDAHKSIPNKENNNIHQIVSFLAILDMIKNGLIYVKQEETNGEIKLELVEKP